MHEPAVSAQELHQLVQARRGRDLGGLRPADLARWAIRHGYAVQVGDRLHPTELARRIGATLQAVELDHGRPL